MPLQINKQLTDETGSTIAKGAHVTFTVIFPADSKEVHYNLWVYRDKTAYDNGYAPFRPTEFTPSYVKRGLSDTEYNSLDVATVNQYLHDHLESILGSETVDML